MHHCLIWLYVAFHAVLCSYGQSTEKLAVHWSMDNYDNAILYPDFPEGSSEWEVDLSDHDAEKIFRTRINGSALYLQQEELILKKDIKRICLHHLDLCDDGLSIMFWIKIDQLTPNEVQVILKTSTINKLLPGIYIGASESNDEIDVLMWAVEAGKYRASFRSSLLGMSIWSHFGLVWRKDDGIKVALNGSWLRSDQYVTPPEVSEVDSPVITFSDLSAGHSVGPEIHIDDMWIYYRNVSEKEISQLYEEMLPPPVVGPETSTSIDADTTSSTSTTAQTKSTTESVNAETANAELSTTRTTDAQQRPATETADTASPKTSPTAKTTSTVSTTEGIPILIPLTVAGSAVAIVLVCSICVAVCWWKKRRK